MFDRASRRHQMPPLSKALKVARFSPAIAAVGDIFFGQRSVQLMCVWQA
jgi:hypothetical protein